MVEPHHTYEEIGRKLKLKLRSGQNAAGIQGSLTSLHKPSLWAGKTQLLQSARLSNNPRPFLSVSPLVRVGCSYGPAHYALPHWKNHVHSHRLRRRIQFSCADADAADAETCIRRGFPSLRGAEKTEYEPFVPTTPYIDAFGTPAAGSSQWPAGSLGNDAIVYDDGRPDRSTRPRRQHLIDQLPVETLQVPDGQPVLQVDLLSTSPGSSSPAPSRGGRGYRRSATGCTPRHLRLPFRPLHQDRNGCIKEPRSCAAISCTWRSHSAVPEHPRPLRHRLPRDIGVPAARPPWTSAPGSGCSWAGAGGPMDARHNHPRIGGSWMARGRERHRRRPPHHRLRRSPPSNRFQKSLDGGSWVRFRFLSLPPDSTRGREDEGNTFCERPTPRSNSAIAVHSASGESHAIYCIAPRGYYRRFLVRRP